MPETLTVRIVVLNYNGEELLPKCIPSIVDAAENAHYPTKITVLDNPSDRSGVEYCREHYADIHIERASENKVLCSFNEYLPKIKEAVVILLNNDIRVDKLFVDPLVKHFEKSSQTFMVAPRVMNFEGTKLEAARSRSGVRFGVFWCDGRYPGYEAEAMTPSETDSSGFGAFAREKFIDLGGYNECYLPGIMEDVELCYKARKRGYKSYYEPQSVVYHIGQASFKTEFGSKQVSEIAHRNNFLFMWRNFKGVRFWGTHLIYLPLRLIFAALRGNMAFLAGFVQAFKKTVHR